MSDKLKLDELMELVNLVTKQEMSDSGRPSYSNLNLDSARVHSHI